MYDLLTNYTSKLLKIFAQMIGRKESGFYSPILRDTLRRGTPSASEQQKRRDLDILADFHGKLPKFRSFSLLPYILYLPEEFPQGNEGETESQSTSTSVVYDGNTIEEVPMSILADEGAIFFEVQPPVYGELSKKDIVAVLSRGDRLTIESLITESNLLINKASEEFRKNYSFDTKGKKGMRIPIISYWGRLADPDSQ